MAYGVSALVKKALPVLQRYGARRAGVFGSYARGQARQESDLDLLVEMPPNASLLDLVGLEQELSEQLGLRVEATTYRALHPHLRSRVLADEIRIL
jgi:predicted nucleotidyltransferase